LCLSSANLILVLPLDAMNFAWEPGAVNLSTKNACRDLANTEPIIFVAPVAADARDDFAGMLDPCAAESGAVLGSLKSRVPSPSNHAVRNEWNTDLERALTQLPEPYRHAVTWRHIEQLSWHEIGRRMGCTADAARKVWSRAIQQLRRELAEHESMA
jgi:RNA polymerase sigma factor (sigma-70 family)